MVMDKQHPVHGVDQLRGALDAAAGLLARADYPHLFRWRADCGSVHEMPEHLPARVASFEEFVSDLERALPEALLFVVIDKRDGQPHRLRADLQRAPVGPLASHRLLPGAGVQGAGRTSLRPPA